MSIRSALNISSFERSHPFLKKKSVIENDQIRQAVLKYQQAIKDLRTDGSKLYFLEGIQRQCSPFKKGKINNFTIMAKLKHLQNTALLNNAEHQKSLRQRNRRKQMNKNNLRKKKSWVKIQKNLNQSYFDIYHKFIHNKSQIQSESFLSTLLPQSRSQTDQSVKQNQSCLKLLNYKQKLKPYRKFSAFIKEKIINKQRQKSQSSDCKKKAQSLQLFKSQEKQIGINKQYYEIVKQMQKKNLADKIKNKQISDQIVNKSLMKIFKKPSKEKQAHSNSIKDKKQYSDSLFIQNKRYGSTGRQQRNRLTNTERNNSTDHRNDILFTSFGLRQRAFQKRESKSQNFKRYQDR